MNSDGLRECSRECLSKKKCCEKKECRLWIDYKQDLNCTSIAIKKNPEMTLNEVSKRLNISIVRVKQIQDEALQKLKKIYDY